MKTVAIAVSVVLGLDWTVGLTLAQQLAVGVALGVVVPVVFFRHARSLWLVVNYLVATAEQRSERERLPAAVKGRALEVAELRRRCGEPGELFGLLGPRSCSSPCDATAAFGMTRQRRPTCSWRRCSRGGY